MLRSDKEALVSQLAEWFSRSSSATLVDPSLLNVHEVSELRKILKKADCGIKVARNRLIELGFKKAFGNGGVDQKQVEFFTSRLKGSSMVVCAFSDPIKPIKELYSFAEKTKKIRVKAAFFESSTYLDSAVESLKELPSRDECLGMLLNLIQAPVQNVLYILNHPARMMVTLLDNHRSKLQPA